MAPSDATLELGVRFVAAAHQRNPIAAVVREDSGLRTPEDLAGARTARWNMPWFAQEYAGAPPTPPDISFTRSTLSSDWPGSGGPTAWPSSPAS